MMMHGPTVWSLGALSSDQRGALNRPAGRCVRCSSALQFVAADLVGRARGERQTRNGSREIGVGYGVADGALVSAAHVVEIARIESLRSPVSSENTRRVALLRPERFHTITPL